MRFRALILAAILFAASTAGRAAEETAGFLPKDDLGVDVLQREMPEADGRGVLVAVLDTGVDLLHPSLQTTSDGKRKIVDFYDGTDAGLVETDFTAKVEEGMVTGLTGRRLTLPEGVSGEVRIGVLRARAVYPPGLRRRLERERKDERKRRQRILSDGGKASKSPPDPGDPAHDVVLWHSEDGWRLIVDTDEDGDLAEEKALREFGPSGDVGVLAGRARLGFGFRVLRKGDAVSLLFDGGGHGTHVAGIIAGYHGEGSPLNGLAPGARILPVKIGNGRFGGPTTHLALIRGLEWAGRAGADVVNISFGGPSHFSDGREDSARFITEAVKKYGYAVCVSAGNAGPAHLTVGAPATSSGAYTIGAWCPPSTQTSNYGVVHPRGGSLFAFSSRGPLPGGAPGVDFIAPGAAVSAVPEWSLVSGRNMNGTSMAAPQASGGLAVLLSAARKEGLPISAARVRHAVETSAKPVPGLTAAEQGRGLINVPGALAALREGKDAPEPVRFLVTGGGGGHFGRAVVTDRPISIEMKLAPDLPKDLPAEARARFSRMLRLVPDAAWLEVASPVHASADGASVRARADPTALAEGMNVAVVRAVDIESGREVGRLVVTLIRPRVVPRCGVWTRADRAVSRGEAHSLFFLVPPGASQVRVEARETAPDGGTRITLADPTRTVREKGAPLTSPLEQGKATVLHRDVREGATLEVVLHRRFRAEPGASEVEIGLAFRGVDPGVSTVTIPRGRLGTHLNLRAGGDVRGHFDAKAEWSEEPLALAWKSAKDADCPLLLGEEAVWVHDGRAGFTVPADRAEVRFDMRFETPFEDYLDDATYRIEDANGSMVAHGHIWRGPFSFRAPQRGSFTLAIRIWERGKRFFRGGGMFSPLLLRKIGTRKVGVKHDVREGFVPGVSGGRTFSLGAGSRSVALLTRPRGGGTVRGFVKFIDDDWGATLFTRSLRIEPPDLPDTQKALGIGLAEFTGRGIRAALDRDVVPAGERTRLAELVHVAKAAGLAKPEWEAAVLLLTARAGKTQAKAALPRLDALVDRLEGEARRPALRARAEAAIRAGDMEKAKKDLAQLRGESEEALYVKFLATRDVDPGKALGLLERFRKKVPPRPSLGRAQFELLVKTGKRAEAAILLSHWTERFPAERDAVFLMAKLLEPGAKEEE